MMTILFTVTWMLSAMFMFLNHPLSFGLILLLQTISVALISGTMNFNYWFSYIIFLVMIGGMLVLFMYMTSVASNEKFKFSPKLAMLFSSSFGLAIILFVYDHFTYTLNLNTSDIMPQDSLGYNELSMIKYMNWPSSLIMYMVISYLLLTLVAVVKITSIEYGPLRQKF
uniref:NADH dehydrogenase subunit 6 n=1 Tax=Xoanodera maculata TaxID=583507 RepID=UPI001F143D22|nr:NADH dehydrogenase subunit 6 [Xoanodera maculata]UKQ56299.1 NADH dehydrogenase subunit 6 [Xoanodera maculata]